MSGAATKALGLIVQAAKSPQGQALLAHTAQQYLRGRSENRRLHWGRSNDGESTIEIGTDGPYVPLGALARIGYLTKKGVDTKVTEYDHTFRPRLPWLYKNGAGDLLIVRGGSAYEITAHGIEG